MDIHHYKFIQTYRMYNTKSDPNVNYGLHLIMMCLCRFISYNKSTTLVGDSDEEVYACVEIGNIWEISGPSA